MLQTGSYSECTENNDCVWMSVHGMARRNLALVKVRKWQQQKKRTAMEEEAHLLPQLEKVPNGDDVGQDCRIHCRFRSKRASIRWLLGTTLACRAAGQRKRVPNDLEQLRSRSPTFLERAMLFTAKVNRNVWHKSQTLRPESS